MSEQQRERLSRREAEGLKRSGYATAGILLLCAVTMLIDGYDVQSLGLAVPALAENFGVHVSELAPAMSSSLLGMAVGAITLAPLSDRWGYRVMASASLALIGVSMLLTMNATGPIALVFWRFVTGLGIGSIAPIVVALAASCSPIRWRTLLVTLVIATMGLGSTIASFIAPAMEARFGWPGIFALGGILSLFAGFLFFAFCPRNVPVRDAPVHASRAPARSVLQLFEPSYRRRTVLLWLVLLVNQMVVYALISWLPALLELGGWGRAEAQRGTGFLAVGGVIGSLSLAWLADRGRAAYGLFAAYGIGAIMVCFFLYDDLSISGWRILLVLTGFSAMGAMSTMGSLAAIYYPSQIRATGVGWASGIGRLGGLLGPLVIAGLLHAGLSPEDILPLLVVPLALCACLVHGLRKVPLASD